MNKEWDRTDYLEEDVRRHSEEIRALTQATSSNATALTQLITETSRLHTTIEKLQVTVERELDRRQVVIEKHETRIRDLESWRSRSAAYWAVFGTLGGTIAAFLISKLGSDILP